MKGDDVSTLSADDTKLLDRMRTHAGGRLYHRPPCVQCGGPNGRICRLSLPIAAGFEFRSIANHDTCDPSALCFECAKMEYTAMVIAGE